MTTSTVTTRSLLDSMHNSVSEKLEELSAIKIVTEFDSSDLDLDLSLDF